MSFLSTVESFWSVTEADVIKFFVTAQNDLITAVAGMGKIMTWVAAHQAQIDSDLQTVLAIASGAGIPMTPELSAAINLIDTSAKAVDAVAATVKANPAASNTQLVLTAGLAAYQAVKGTQGAVAAAQASVAGQTAAPAPATS